MAMNRTTRAARERWESSAVQERIDAIDLALHERLTDSRCLSGIPGRHSATDLEFIQMTGLTRPAKDRTAFSEGTMPPTAAPSSARSRSADALRELIADLTREVSSTARTAEASETPAESPPPWDNAWSTAFGTLADGDEVIEREARPVERTAALFGEEELGDASQTLKSLDSLIDEISREEDMASPPLPTVDRGLAIRVVDETAAPEQRLMEAETLLQELEQQARDVAAAATDRESDDGEVRAPGRLRRIRPRRGAREAGGRGGARGRRTRVHNGQRRIRVRKYVEPIDSDEESKGDVVIVIEVRVRGRAS